MLALPASMEWTQQAFCKAFYKWPAWPNKGEIYLIHTWWWQLIGTLSFFGVIIGALMNLFEVQTVEVKEKSPAGNWTLGKTHYKNYSTVRHNQQRRKTS